MKVTWNKVTNLPVITFEDADYVGANHVEELLSGHFTCRKCSTVNENTSWKVLNGYFTSMRLTIEELGKAYARTRAKRDICSNVFSILDGFDMAVNMPKKIVLQAEMIREQDKKKETHNGNESDTDD